MSVRGHATDGEETFLFTIGPAHTGRDEVRLDIQYSGKHGDGMTGAGLWPTVEKAKAIAQSTANRMLKGAIIHWEHLN